MSRYGVQAGAFSKDIYVGRLNTDGTTFTDKAEMTPEVLHAVADWAKRNHHGDAWVEVGGLRLDIKVTDLTASPSPDPVTTHIRNDELERERQAARGGDDWAARGMTTDDDIEPATKGNDHG